MKNKQDKEAEKYIQGVQAGQVRLARFILEQQLTEVADFAWLLAKLKDIAEKGLTKRDVLV